MRLDASVHCNCIKNGIETPHPCPNLLRLGETSEPISGVHTGDFIEAQDSVRLLEEARRLREMSNDAILQQFAADLIEVAEASVATGSPIVF